MKNLALTLLLFVSCQMLSAQQGTLRGSVYDDTGFSLPGAAVVLKGTTTGASTAFDGKYSLDLPVGTHDIEVSFVSFAKQTITGVEIKDGEVTILDIKMVSDAQVFDKEVVITAKQARNTESALLSMQKKSTNVIDGVSSQQFTKVGDSNAAAAIKRIPGVSVQGGKHVYVRGLGDRYTKTILNGMSIPGLDPDRNSVQMDIFPTATIDNIVVYKTFSPDLAADFTGGMIDVVTKDFPEEKTFGFGYSAGFNPDMTFNENNISYEGGKLDLLGFDDGTREIPLGESWQIPDATQDDPRLTTYTGAFNRTMAAEQKGNFFDQSFNVNAGNMKKGGKYTFGYNGLLNYRLDYDHFEEVEQGFYLREPNSETLDLRVESTRKGRQSQQDVLWSGLLTGAIKNNTSSLTLNLFRTQGATSQAVDRTSSEQEQISATLVEDILMFSQRSLSNASLNFKHRFKNENELEIKNSFSKSTLDDPDFRVASFSVVDGDTLLRFGDGARIERFWRELDENNLGSKVDYTIPLEYSNGEKGKIKFGGAGVRKNRDFSILRYTFSYETNGGTQASAGDPNWYFEEENLWTVDSQVGTVVGSNGFEPSNTYKASQNVYAGYGLHDYSFTRRFKTVYGVRLEQTTMTYTGIDQSGTRVFRNTETLNELNVLPSLNTVYKLTENSNLRASYNKTLARPSFREKSVAQIFDPISKITFLGNIDIEQTNIDNVDLRWETFPNRGEVISVSGFYKRFDGHIELAVFETAVDNLKPVNSGISQVFGIELEARKALNFISDMSRVVSIGGNISIVESRMDMATVVLPGNTESELDIRRQSARDGETIDQYRTMAGQSPFLINAYLNVSNSEKGIDANLSYNVQGRTLSIVGLGLIPDVYAAPRHLINLRFAKQIGSKGRSSISLRMNNLLDQDRLLSYDSFNAPEETYSRFSDGRDFIIGYRYNLR